MRMVSGGQRGRRPLLLLIFNGGARHCEIRCIRDYCTDRRAYIGVMWRVIVIVLDCRVARRCHVCVICRDRSGRRNAGRMYTVLRTIGLPAVILQTCRRHLFQWQPSLAFALRRAAFVSPSGNGVHQTATTVDYISFIVSSPLFFRLAHLVSSVSALCSHRLRARPHSSGPRL